MAKDDLSAHSSDREQKKETEKVGIVFGEGEHCIYEVYNSQMDSCWRSSILVGESNQFHSQN